MGRSLYCLLAAASLLLNGCGGGAASNEDTASPRQVRVDWLGNQCFRISSSIGTSILTNPFADGTGGRTLPSSLKPDIVLVSHEKPEANNVDALDNQPAVFRGSMGLGLLTSSGIRIRGVAAFATEQQTAEGMNVVYAWTMDGVRFCFLGALTRPLNSEQLAQLGVIDVVFVPVAGSLSPEARDTVLSQLRPRLIIPMGRGAGGWTAGAVIHVPGSSVLISRPSLPLQMTTLLFGS